MFLEWKETAFCTVKSFSSFRTMSKMICPLSSVEPRRHRASPPTDESMPFHLQTH